jgi:hypothetical protein
VRNALYAARVSMKMQDYHIQSSRTKERNAKRRKKKEK